MFNYITFIVVYRLFFKHKRMFLLSILTVIGVSLGIALFILVTSIMNGFEYFIQKKTLFFTPHIILTTKKNYLDTKLYPVKNFYLNGVRNISPIITSETILFHKKNIAISNIVSFEKKSFNPIKNYIDKKTYNDFVSYKNYIVLGKELANELGVKKKDKVKLIIPNTLKINFYKNLENNQFFTVCGFFSTNSEIDYNTILIRNVDAIKLMNYNCNDITGWRIYLKNPLDVENIKKQFFHTEIVWHDWRDKNGELFLSIKIEKIIMVFLLSFIFIVSSFNIFITLSFFVVDKEYEIAVLKSLGFRQLQIIKIFILYGLKDNILGSVIGIFLGILFSKKINFVLSCFSEFYKYVEIPILINFTYIFLSCLFIFFIYVLSVFCASLYAFKIDSVKILRYE